MTFGKRSFEVCFEDQWFYKSPKCPHGPMLLFEKFVSGKNEERRYFACSASRNRKECNFFMWENDFNRKKTLNRNQHLDSIYPKYERLNKPNKDVSTTNNCALVVKYPKDNHSYINQAMIVENDLSEIQVISEIGEDKFNFKKG